jgi:thimet oligopeptidase
MKKLSFVFFVILYYCQPGLKAQQNPLITHSNSPIPFDKITTATLLEASALFYKEQEKRIQKIAAIPAGKHTLANTLMAFDEIQTEMFDIQGKFAVVYFTNTNDSIRRAASEILSKASAYSTNLFLNEVLHKALNQLAVSPQANNLLPDQKKYLTETVSSFEKNGMKLPAEDRKELKLLNEKIANLETQFDANISKSKDSILFSVTELDGIPADIITRWKKQEDKYIVYVNQPNWKDLMKYADNDSTRLLMYLHYYNRAYPANITVLDSMLYYRQLLADKLGFKSFAAYALIDKMAASPANVWNFLNDLVSRVKPLVASEMEELRQLKKQISPQQANSIYDWDFAYYSNKLLNNKFQLNSNELKEYFELNNTLRGMFTVYEKLLGIQIRQTKNIPVWQEKVTSYELYKDEKKMGNFYLDLFSRPGKYTHNQCVPIRCYKKINGNEILPVGVLICNFPEGTKVNPSLLTMDYMTTMFHEFGHLVHWLLSHPGISSQNMFTIKGDFLEAPSQLLENWLFEYDALKIFARHYKTGATLPKTLFDKLKQSQKAADGSKTIYQLYNTLIDLTFHDKYDSIKIKDLNEVAKDLNAFRQIPFVKGSHWIYSFTHLQVYPANYYGYLWSKVFAKDMFSMFQKNGVMDTKTGIRYRKEILEKGSSENEMEMLRIFIGREPNSKAFMRSMGLN